MGDIAWIIAWLKDKIKYSYPFKDFRELRFYYLSVNAFCMLVYLCQLLLSKLIHEGLLKQAPILLPSFQH